MAISPQDIHTNADLKAAKHLRFPILSDGDLRVIHRYGIFRTDDPKKRFLPHPSTFVVNARGIIVWQYVGDGVRDRPTNSQLLAVLDTNR